MGYTEEIENHLKNKEDHEIPRRPDCHKCGGTVMTPQYEFSDAESGY